MPVHLKNFYLRDYMDLKKKEKEHIDKAKQSPKQSIIPRRFNPK